MFLLLLALFRATSGSIDPSTAAGHLEKLGSRGPIRKVAETTGFLDPETFYRQHTKKFRPIVFRDAAKQSPAFERWTDDYLKATAQANPNNGGDLVVEARKKENRSAASYMMSLDRFIDSYRRLDIYMVASVPEFLRNDVVLPRSLACGGFSRNLVDTVIWFSSGGTKSVLHHDDVDNINCLLAGTKELYFIEYPKFRDKVPLDRSFGGYSSLDVDHVDFVKFPGMMDVEYEYVKMEAGDCLYIPFKWYHQVRSYDRNIAVNVWWNPLLAFNKTDCEENPSLTPTLNDFDWPGMKTKDEEEEEGEEEEGGSDDDNDPLRKFLKSFLKKDSEALTVDEFIPKIKSRLLTPNSGLWWSSEMNRIAKEIFDLIDFNKDNFFTKTDLAALTESEFTTINDLANDIDEVIDDIKMGVVTRTNDVENDDDATESDDAELTINDTEKDEL
ncbi:uncharacterized protein [Oscarella lobularis]|uniref:uncharacterized protein isoform X1 n=1 Tax=Oscarella lobularis TaxID=121494 RepID=UPI0033140E67